MCWGGSAPAVTDTFGYLADAPKELNVTHLHWFLRLSVYFGDGFDVTEEFRFIQWRLAWARTWTSQT